MTIVAGFLSGTLMALVFVAHLSLMFVYNPPSFIKTTDPEDNHLARSILMMHGVALVIWPIIGVVIAVAYSAVQGEVSDWVFVVGVLVTELLMAPVLLILAKGRRLHLLAEFAAFFIIFGIVVPILVSKA
ncbi:MAG: hypothetical protein OTJ98_06665 [Dehalococcoidia bacterium]|nr:hypothetical protein [Dehalococcoidia bacterium]